MDFKTNIPIYIQIATQIKEQIMSGSLKDGDKLPSVREYSIIFEVSALTIQRAIGQLDIEGVVRSKKGVGSFILKGSREEMEDEMVGKQVQLFVENMRNMGIEGDKIIQLVKGELHDE